MILQYALLDVRQMGYLQLELKTSIQFSSMLVISFSLDDK